MTNSIRLEVVLRELVALKDLKDSYSSHPEYESRQSLLFNNAINILKDIDSSRLITDTTITESSVNIVKHSKQLGFDMGVTSEEAKKYWFERFHYQQSSKLQK